MSISEDMRCQHCRQRRAIEAGDGGPTSEQAALELLRRFAGWETGPDHDDRDDIAKAYRAAAMATHPDRGGDPDDFRAVQLALEVLTRGQ